MNIIEGQGATKLFIRTLNVLVTQGKNKTNIGNLGKEVKTKEVRPVVIINHNPINNVLMVPFRQNNPFAQAAEGLWTLAGRCDVEFMDHFVGALKNYSDGGKIYNAAYGYRLIHYDTGEDSLTNQIVNVVAELSHDWRSRRAAMTIWDPFWDNHWYFHKNAWIKYETKDTPCNDFLMFKVVEDESNQLYLDMTVINRSNDLILGLFNVNIIQFSLIQQLIATMCGFKVGTYYHYTDSLHIYEKDYKLVETILKHQNKIVDPYEVLNLGLGGAEFSSAWNQGKEPNDKINQCDNYIRDLNGLCTEMNGRINTFEASDFTVENIQRYVDDREFSAGFDQGLMYTSHVVPFIWAYPIIKGLHKCIVDKDTSDPSYDVIAITALDAINALIQSSTCQDWILAGYRFIAKKFHDTYLDEIVITMIKNALVDRPEHYEFLERLWAIEKEISC